MRVTTFCTEWEGPVCSPHPSELLHLNQAGVQDLISDLSANLSSTSSSRQTRISSTSSSSDTTDPQITGLSFSPSSIDTSSSSQTVTATISITDDTALPDGTYLNVDVRLMSPSKNQFIDFGGYTGSEETGGTSVSRTFKRTSTDGGLLSFQANNQKNSNIES